MTEQELAHKILKQKDLFALWVARPSSIQRDELLKLFMVDIVGTNYIALPLGNGNTGYFCEENKLEDFYQQFGKKLISNWNIKEHLSTYKKSAQELIKLSQKVFVIKENKVALLKFYQDWLKKLGEYSLYFLTPYLIENQFETELKDILKKKFPQKEDEYFEIIAKPSIVFAYQEYQIELVKMGLKIDYAYLINKYRWIPEYSFREILLDKNMIDQEMERIVQDGLTEEILKIKHNVQNNQEDYFKLISSITDERLKVLIELVHTYVNIRTERIEIFKQCQTNLRDFYKIFTKLVKKEMKEFDYSQTISLTNQEIIDFLNGKTTFDLTQIDLREKKQYLSIYIGDNIFPLFIYNQNLIQEIRTELTHEEAREQFKGISAFKGKVTGKVQIIIKKEEFVDFKKDCILVTQFTTPAYIPLMKMAKAIITNDGGITCHAAIISREFNIPCVVGTKIATQVLKDGDVIEVDADKGIIKIIKHS
ncbi:hypothetical protein COY27_00040 [Candidatus Woesearchaeota archaeon CG_4_10_14_0_2_um_filter_33_13]|nr:MAG: hypothetical protein COY27_00040 [Candidatus Woesearchaeota archaeon CG_4_10_14_0_2_um_filter_33_13]